MSEELEEKIQELFENQIQIFLHRVKKMFNKDQHYSPYMHRAHIDF